MSKKYAVKLIKAASGPSEILVHGPIGKSFWSEDGISGKDFTDALNEIPKGQKVVIGVNSQGGSVGEGLAIYNAIQRRSEDITVRIDGYALSIASFFPLAASKVVSPKSSIWMIHNAWSWSQGNAKQLRKDAELLDTLDTALVQAYVSKTGKPEKEIRQAMEEETWFSGEEAIAYGLADEEGDHEADLNALDFSAVTASTFKHIPGNCLAAFSKFLPQLSAHAGGANQNQNKENSMRKNVIALLTKHGVKVQDNWTDEQLAAELEKIEAALIKKPESEPANVAATAGEIAKLQETVAALNKRIEGDRKTRIESSVQEHVDACRIPKEQTEKWVARAIADETVLADLSALPDNRPERGGLAIHQGRVSVLTDGPMDAINKKIAARIDAGTLPKIKAAAARYAEMREGWDDLFAEACRRDARREHLPMADNTYSATLVTSMLSDGAITTLQNRLAALMAFTRDFGTDRLKPLADIVIRHVTGGPTVQTNPTNFESGDTVIAPVVIDPAHYTSACHVTAAELNKGTRMSDMVEITIAKLADKIMEVASVPMTEAIFTQTPVTAAAASFGNSELKALWGRLKKSPIHNIVLDGEYFAQFLPDDTTDFDISQPSRRGWDVMALNTNWTGAGENVVGIALNPQAIAVGAGLPISPLQSFMGSLSEQVITIPGPNISIVLYTWLSLATRTMWASYELIFGAKEADTTAAVLIKSA